MKRLLATFLILFLTITATSCTAEQPAVPDEEKPDPNERIKALLPLEVGYEWVYFGIAEYAHRMTLDSIEEEPNEDEITYHITGEVEDASGGEADMDFSIELEYEIEEGQLTQEFDSEAMMDTNFEEIILIKTPLEQGNFWEQDVVANDGKELKLECKIIEVIEEQGVKIYTVLYDDPNSDWYEQRKFKEGVGVTEYQRLIEADGAQTEISYKLHEQDSGTDAGKTK